MGIAKVSIEVVGFAGKVQSKERIRRDKAAHKVTRVRLSNFGVQIGAFKRYAGAKLTQKEHKLRYPQYQTVIKEFADIDGDGEPLYRVWLMGFGSEQEARDFKNNNDLVGAFIVRN
jgi:rare lipoprotein A